MTSLQLQITTLKLRSVLFPFPDKIIFVSYKIARFSYLYFLLALFSTKVLYYKKTELQYYYTLYKSVHISMNRDSGKINVYRTDVAIGKIASDVCYRLSKCKPIHTFNAVIISFLFIIILTRHYGSQSDSLSLPNSHILFFFYFYFIFL